MVTRLIWGVLLGTTLLLTGCGGPTQAKVFPVKGKLLKAGQPLGGGIRISLVPSDGKLPGSLADVTPDGTFTFKCADGQDGAVAGKHKVVLEMLMQPENYARGKRPTLPFDAKYNSTDSTPLEVEIKPSPDNDLTIEVK